MVSVAVLTIQGILCAILSLIFGLNGAFGFLIFALALVFFEMCGRISRTKLDTEEKCHQKTGLSRTFEEWKQPLLSEEDDSVTKNSEDDQRTILTKIFHLLHMPWDV